jgi:hypothetical protein
MLRNMKCLFFPCQLSAKYLLHSFFSSSCLPFPLAFFSHFPFTTRGWWLMLLEHDGRNEKGVRRGQTSCSHFPHNLLTLSLSFSLPFRHCPTPLDTRTRHGAGVEKKSDGGKSYRTRRSYFWRRRNSNHALKTTNYCKWWGG